MHFKNRFTIQTLMLLTLLLGLAVQTYLTQERLRLLENSQRENLHVIRLYFEHVGGDNFAPAEELPTADCLRCGVLSRQVFLGDTVEHDDESIIKRSWRCVNCGYYFTTTHPAGTPIKTN